MAGSRGQPLSAAGALSAQVIQRQAETPFSGRVRSPVAEEFLTQETEVVSGLQGMPLTLLEIELARTVFGGSIDYPRVRLMHAPEFLWFRTVGNVIRVPPFFTVDSSAPASHHPLSVEYMRHTFIHEMTHVWQYQHSGTSYISYALGPQILAMALGRGRNSAYCYEADPAKSFWIYARAARADRREFLPYTGIRKGAAMRTRWPARLGNRPGHHWPFVPIHERYVGQMRAAIPATEADIRLQRAAETPAMTAVEPSTVPPERRLTPIKPILEIRF